MRVFAALGVLTDEEITAMAPAARGLVAAGRAARLLPFAPVLWPVPRARHEGCAGEPAVSGSAGEVLVRAGDGQFPGGSAVRAGDVVRVGCAFAETTVLAENEANIVIGWPWCDPSDRFHRRGFARDPSSRTESPFEVEPDAQGLHTGDGCRIGITHTDVYATRVTATIPRNATTDHLILGYQPLGESPIGGFAEDLRSLDPYEDPVEVSLIHRAYAFMRPGDQVLDATGTVLWFHPPVVFLAVYAAESLDDAREWPSASAPVWPLVLRERDGTTANAAAAEEVRAATTTGCHDGELERWEAAAGVTLPPEWDLVPWFVEVGGKD